MEIEYGLVGEKLGHSYSVPIHALFGSYDYRLYERTPAEAEALFRSRAFRGLNVTIPYKKLAYDCCDEVSDTARAIGSVNTLLVRKDGTLYGHNTDIDGFIAMLESAAIRPEGKKCLILGSGGTGLTARAALTQMGAGEIVTVSRSGEDNYQNLYDRHGDARVLVNCTPVGMYPENGVSPVDLAKLPCLEAVADVIYNPERTRLLLDAEKRGIPRVGGLRMLVAQAREAAVLFGGKEIPLSEVERVTGAMRSSMLNLVLIGMPGCGKTTLGLKIAELTGRKFIDCDAEIVKKARLSIPAIFETRGERGFRSMETAVLREVTRLSGAVIATGGGAVTRKENIDLLRQNGRVCHVQRDLGELSYEGRPLSRSYAAVEKLWQQRRDLYAAAADFEADNNGSIAETAKQIIDGFQAAAEDT